MTVLPSAAMASSPSGGGDGSGVPLLNVTYFAGSCTENPENPEDPSANVFVVSVVLADAEFAKASNGDIRFLIGDSTSQVDDWIEASSAAEYDSGRMEVLFNIVTLNQTCTDGPSPSPFVSIDAGNQSCRFGAFDADDDLVAISPVLMGFIPDPT